MRVAVIDLGTNTFNLVVAEREGARLRVVHSAERAVFLGRDGIEDGRITPVAVERGIEALRVHVEAARHQGATHIAAYGTSALRSAVNATDLTRRAEHELGVIISIIDGDTEAGLILEGVRLAVPFGDRPALVMDIGGGSMEFILATGRAVMWKRSFELGVTRLRQRVPFSEPPTLEEEMRLAAHLDERLEPLWAVIDRHEPHVLVGSAGSFDSLAAMVTAARGVPLLPSDLTLPFDDMAFSELKDGLMRMPREERAGVPGLPPHRVDHIAYGLVAIERVLTAGGIRELAWSRYALKEGAAHRALDRTTPDA